MFKNPLLPLNEYIPDGEPHVFGQRVYLFGSHDEMNGPSYCPLDYVAYSASIDALDEWQYEGVIYRKEQDPCNSDGRHALYAPDVTCGSDGRYYLYYVLDGVDAIGVAVCDTPAGHYEYYGEVRLPNGNYEKPIAFDPAICHDGEHYYLSYGFSFNGTLPSMELTPENTKGAYVVELDKDMLSMKHEPKLVIPGYAQGKGTSFEGHEFLEASSLRKFDDFYYFIYSSQAQHELCYAMSHYPDHDFTYQGILISNADKYSENEIYKNNYANNHGSIEKIKDTYYLFYHRHTYGKQYSRQACGEVIIRNDQGLFETTQITSQGLTTKPLAVHQTIPAALACIVYDEPQGEFIPFSSNSMNKARIEGSKIVNITNSMIAYRYFEAVPESICLNMQAAEGYAAIYINGELMIETVLTGNKTICLLPATDKQAELQIHFHCIKPAVLESIQV